MIRRQKSMRFLGGYYAFPGGKVDPTDGSAEALARCRGSPRPRRRLAAFPPTDGVPPLAFWVAAARELLEETGVLVGCDADGRAVDARDPAVRRPGRARCGTPCVGEARAALPRCSPREGWYLDLAPFRYLSHFITPPSSPIRFTARFFLAPVPAGTGARACSARRPRRASGSIPPRATAASSRGDAHGRAGRQRARLPRRVRQLWTRSGPLTPTAGTSSTASSTASKRPASAFPAASASARAEGGPGWTTRRPSSSTSRSRRATGARTALVTPVRPVTYAELQRLADRAAHALRSRGVEPEQRVAAAPARRPRLGRDLLRRAQARRGGGPAQHAARRRPSCATVLADCRPKALVADRAVLAAAGVEAATLGPARD